MNKDRQVVNHGTLMDTVNVNALIKTQANIPACIGGKKRVISVKVKTRQKPKVQVKSLKKVISTLK